MAKYTSLCSAAAIGLTAVVLASMPACTGSVVISDTTKTREASGRRGFLLPSHVTCIGPDGQPQDCVQAVPNNRPNSDEPFDPLTSPLRPGEYIDFEIKEIERRREYRFEGRPLDILPLPFGGDAERSAFEQPLGTPRLIGIDLRPSVDIIQQNFNVDLAALAFAQLSGSATRIEIDWDSIAETENWLSAQASTVYVRVAINGRGPNEPIDERVLWLGTDTLGEPLWDAVFQIVQDEAFEYTPDEIEAETDFLYAQFVTALDIAVRGRTALMLSDSEFRD